MSKAHYGENDYLTLGFETVGYAIKYTVFLPLVILGWIAYQFKR